MVENSIRWLHLSDLHVGMQSQGWLWPTMKSVVLDDLKRVFGRVGPWDLVIFSGDITQRGSSEEFERATNTLQELWGHFDSLGFAPSLFAVPGNHDLTRPRSNDPGHLLLKQWWDLEEVRADTWSVPSSIYRHTLSNAFSTYTAWIETLSGKGIPVMEGKTGLMPGDTAGTTTINGVNVGIVGLNSSWLQLDGGDAKGKLSVDPRQLNVLLDDEPQKWRERHDLSLLVTHHPVDWLHPTARDDWYAEIDPAGRFDAHLYGHMHEPDVLSVAHGGSAARHQLQAASLFGLEKVSSLKVDRIHGYSVGQYQSGEGIRIWPRRSTKLRSGGWKLVANEEMDLEDDGSFLLNAQHDTIVEPSDTRLVLRSKAGFPLSEDGENVLEKIRFYVPPSTCSVNVRRVEQRIALSALAEMRAVWITAEWGSRSNGFVRAVQEHANDEGRKTYKVDLSEYAARGDFLAGLKAKLGFTFEQMCDALSEAGPAYLILEDVPVRIQLDNQNEQSIVADIEDMVSVVLTYCPELKIILRTRRVPSGHIFPATVLRPLDEADLAVYISEHEHGGPRFGRSDAISAIFRHTDGVPARIDAALRELKVIPLDALTSVNRDIVRADGTEDVPKALAAAVLDLKASEEPTRKRSFDLLKALAAFPRGETLQRIKRFYGSTPLYPNHAHELLDKSLIASGLATSGPGTEEIMGDRLLTVPRTVRDYVRSLTSAEELADLTRQAATLYFGDRWHLGEIRPILAAKFNKPNASSAEIENASAIVLRLVHDAIEKGTDHSLDGALNLAKAYTVALFAGDHFRSVVTLSSDLIRLIPDGYEASKEFFKYEHARALRMIGEHANARDALLSLDHSYLSKSMKQSALLSLSLAYQSLGDSADATNAANEALRVDRHSHGALQAKSIILDEHDDEDHSATELRKLEEQCRKKGADLVANNIALTRIGKDGNAADVDLTVMQVLKSAASADDFYNAARAIIKKAELYNKNGSELSDKDKDLLINTYHFLLSERLSGLFDRCHDALWNVFEAGGESGNLFSLFRHSSLIWRLRGDKVRERRYLTKLARHAEAVITRDFRRLDKEVAYYLVRQGAEASVSERS